MVLCDSGFEMQVESRDLRNFLRIQTCMKSAMSNYGPTKTRLNITANYGLENLLQKEDKKVKSLSIKVSLQLFLENVHRFIIIIG